VAILLPRRDSRNAWGRKEADLIMLEFRVKRII